MGNVLVDMAASDELDDSHSRLVSMLVPLKARTFSMKCSRNVSASLCFQMRLPLPGHAVQFLSMAVPN